MEHVLCRCAAVAVAAMVPVCIPGGGAWGDDGYVNIFDGRTLKGWDGDSRFWSVQDGAITGRTTRDNPTEGNTFIIWRGGYVTNFELKLEYRIDGGNSGIQYRSFEVADQPWVVGGYQADLKAGDRTSGALYGELFRGVLAGRGDRTELTRNDDGEFVSRVTGSVGESDEIQKQFRTSDWNEYHVIVDGYTFRHRIDGDTTCVCTDNDTRLRRTTGIVALQLHTGPPMTVQFRNVRVKRLPATKRVALIAGSRSHGYGAHEHRAGCLLLAKALGDSPLPVETSVHTGGWPENDSVLDNVDSIVIYCDGGARHPFNAHLDRLQQLSRRGVGIVCIHYGVEVPQGPPGRSFLDWTGGYFEKHWSVNPHWQAKYLSFPEHSITNGVKPFSIKDEWYFHIRFREGMDGVTPILTDLPPSNTLVRADGTLARPDNGHNNNPHARTAILERRESQHMAWARQRPDAGRGFGFTGGHVHWNWGHNQFRKLVLNAIAWTAHLNVPPDGVPSQPLTVEDLQANQDYEVPDDFNPARWQKLIEQWNSSS